MCRPMPRIKDITASNWRTKSDQLYDMIKNDVLDEQVKTLHEVTKNIKDPRISSVFEHDVYGRLVAFRDGQGQKELDMGRSGHVSKIAVSALFVCVIFGFIGVILTFLQPFGIVEIDAWGFELNTTHVGIASLAIGALIGIKIATKAIDVLGK